MDTPDTLRMILICLLAACSAAHQTSSADASAPTLSPVGTWNVDVAWGAGTCGDASSLPQSPKDGFVVAATDTDYSVTDIYSSMPTTGTVSCTATECALEATETLPTDGGGTWVITESLTLYPTGLVKGTGQTTVTGTTNCTQAFSLRGLRH